MNYFYRWKMTFVATYIPVVILFLGLAVFIPALHAEQPYDITTCYSGEVTMVYASKELVALGYELKGITLDNQDNKLWENSTLHCTGISKVVAGKPTANYYCKFMSPEGDIAIGEGSRTGAEGIWKFIGGTGKWKGITGGGKNERFTRGKPISEGTIQGCSSATGTFELPQ